MRILLTGAGGFVGGQLLSRLKQQHHFVRALSRTAAHPLERADETIIETLCPGSDFKAHLSGIDVVVHLADGFNAFEHLPDSVQNSEATRRLQTTIALANDAAQNGVRFVYLSTVKAMCGTYANEILGEETMPHPQSLYGRLKLEAEQAILLAAQKHGSKAVILRFPIVFGRDVGGNMEKLLALADTPLPLPFKGLKNKRSLISIESLIEAVIAIIEQEDAGEGRFLVHDDVVASEELVSLLRRGLDRPLHIFSLPPSLWSVLSAAPLLGGKLQRFTRPLQLDDRKFRNTYNWQPKKSLATLLTEYAGDARRG